MPDSRESNLRERLKAAVDPHVWQEFASTGESVSCVRVDDALGAVMAVVNVALAGIAPYDLEFGYGPDPSNVDEWDTYQEALYRARTYGGTVYWRQLYAGPWSEAASKAHEITVVPERRLDGGTWHRAKCWCGYVSALHYTEAKACHAGNDHVRAKNARRAD